MRSSGRWAIGLILLGFAWRAVRYAVNFPLSVDEASLVVHFLDRDFAGLLQPLGYAQVAPLGFLWSELALVRLLGPGEWVLRLGSFLACAAALAFFPKFARDGIGERRSAGLAAGVFACSYFVVRHGAEAKPYAGDVLIALALLSLAWAVLSGAGGKAPWAALLLLAPVAVWFSYPAAFVVGGVGMTLAFHAARERSGRMLAACAAFGALAAGSFASMYLFVGRAQASSIPSWMANYWADAFPPLRQPGRLLLWLLDAHTGTMLAYPVGGARGGSALMFVCAAAGGVTLWRKRRDLLLLLLSPLPFAFVAAALHRYPYGDATRTSLYMAPAFCLLDGVGLVTILKAVLPRRRVPLGLRLAAGVLAAIAAAGIAIDVLRPYKEPVDVGFRAVIERLAGEAAPGDSWAVIEGLKDPRFRFYVSRQRRVPVRLKADPDELARASDRRVALIAFTDRWTHLPKVRLHECLDALAKRQGPWRHRVFPLDTGPETIHLYTFGVRSQF